MTGRCDGWIAFHSVHELTFVVALVACWKLPPIRWALLVLLGVHVAVRVWTIAYFAPTIIAFQGLPASPPTKSKASDHPVGTSRPNPSVA